MQWIIDGTCLAATITAAGQADNVAASVLYTNRTGTETANAASIGGTGAGREQPDPQQSETDNLNAKVAFTPFEAHQFTLGFDRYTSDLAPAFLASGGVEPTDGMHTFQSVNREEVVIQGLELRASVDIGNGFAARAALAYADGSDEQRDEPLDSVEPPAAGQESALRRCGGRGRPPSGGSGAGMGWSVPLEAAANLASEAGAAGRSVRKSLYVARRAHFQPRPRPRRAGTATGATGGGQRRRRARGVA